MKLYRYYTNVSYRQGRRNIVVDCWELEGRVQSGLVFVEMKNNRKSTPVNTQSIASYAQATKELAWQALVYRQAQRVAECTTQLENAEAIMTVLKKGRPD